MNTSVIPDFIQEVEKEKIIEAARTASTKGIHCLVGETLDIDSFQIVLELLGYRKGSLGSGSIWYRNITEGATGYIAEIEAISPEGHVLTAVVEYLDIAGFAVKDINELCKK